MLANAYNKYKVFYVPAVSFCEIDGCMGKIVDLLPPVAQKLRSEVKSQKNRVRTGITL